MSNIYNDLIKVIDENSDDIIWRTTENGHKVGFKGKEAVAGNKEVIKELNQNSPTITKEFTKKDFNNFTKEDLRKSKAYRQYAINALSKELNFKPITNTYFEESDWSYQEISLPDGVTGTFLYDYTTGKITIGVDITGLDEEHTNKALQMSEKAQGAINNFEIKFEEEHNPEKHLDNIKSAIGNVMDYVGEVLEKYNDDEFKKELSKILLDGSKTLKDETSNILIKHPTVKPRFFKSVLSAIEKLKEFAERLGE